jgi:hypothetical protein
MRATNSFALFCRTQIQGGIEADSVHPLIRCSILRAPTPHRATATLFDSSSSGSVRDWGREITGLQQYSDQLLVGPNLKGEAEYPDSMRHSDEI